ncbi:hypothetical protein MRS76_15895 [Rhizobiaceae bacterium n13]|uniref:Uncharacterized protein n=1 Tax=Ferirhizobium litorale TaxID=2927786 RepID=A0AAE3U0P7_9HYPH|nr:hypothetical protein [Fererhizobium litorale]MDI7863439.1 hypothetical protein [Fererhizobium litorale]MDI7922284.1 hypothetical protein [Fererhizobium litorale]
MTFQHRRRMEIRPVPESVLELLQHPFDESVLAVVGTSETGWQFGHRFAGEPDRLLAAERASCRAAGAIAPLQRRLRRHFRTTHRKSRPLSAAPWRQSRSWNSASRRSYSAYGPSVMGGSFLLKRSGHAQSVTRRLAPVA